MATAVRLGRGAEDARSREAKSSRRETSQEGGGRLWSAREQGGHSEPSPTFKYLRPYNRQIQNQRPDPIWSEIVWRKAHEEW